MQVALIHNAVVQAGLVPNALVPGDLGHNLRLPSGAGDLELGRGAPGSPVSTTCEETTLLGLSLHHKLHCF